MNLIADVGKKSEQRKGRVVLSIGRQSIGNRSIASTNSDTCDSLGSVDREWMRIQETMKEVNQLNLELQNEMPGVFFDPDEDCCRAITFDSPDREQGNRNPAVDQHEDVNLLRRSIELDEDNAEIEDYQVAMEENFMLMFAEITLRRLNAKRKCKKQIDIYEFVHSLNLRQYPHIQWANVLEDSICQACR